jgi:hypothetical protein
MNKGSDFTRDILWKWQLSRMRKILHFKNHYMLITHGSETRTWTKTDVSRLTAARCLKNTEGKAGRRENKK